MTRTRVLPAMAVDAAILAGTILGCLSLATQASGQGISSRPKALERHSTAATATDLAKIPWNAIDDNRRAMIYRVLSHPTLVSLGPSQSFVGDPLVYAWLLDHPDQTVRVWRHLGARCLMIDDLGDGRFGWADGQGNTLAWHCDLSNASLRLWYAEGVFRPLPFLSPVPVRAVVLLQFSQRPDARRGTILHHQAALYFQTDSRAVAMAMHFLGASAPELAEQCVTQLEVFFSAIAWYLQLHPEQLGTLCGPANAKAAPPRPLYPPSFQPSVSIQR